MNINNEITITNGQGIATEIYAVENPNSAYVVSNELYPYERTYTTMNATDLSGDVLTNTYALSISRMYFDEENNVLDSGVEQRATVYVPREALLMFAREVIAKFDKA